MMLGLINIRSPIYSQLCHALRKYTKYQIPVTKTCWQWTSLKQCNKTQPPPPSPPDPSHPKRTCSFNRPCSPSLNETRDSKKLFHTQSSYFDGPTNFPHLNFPTTVPANLRPPHPLPPPHPFTLALSEGSPGDAWPQSLVATLLITSHIITSYIY